MIKVKIFKAKFHDELEKLVNEFIETLNFRPEQMMYQDSESGCSCMIVYIKR